MASPLDGPNLTFHTFCLEWATVCQQNLEMSGAGAHRSHVTIWIASLGAALLLYAASWPPIELKVCGGNPEFAFYSGGLRFPPPPPAWIVTLYRPMHYMETILWRHGDPVGRYYSWWKKRLSM